MSSTSSDPRRWLVAADSTIVNAVLWDGDPETWQPPEGCDVLDATDLPGVDIGWVMIDGVWTEPEPEPEPVDG